MSSFRFYNYFFVFVALPFMAWSNTIVVENFYARPTTGPNGAAFLSLSNQSTKHVKLIGASMEECSHVELHTHLKEGDIYRMRSIPYIMINPGSTVSLEPGGLHLMLMKLKRPLVAGEEITIALHFEDQDKQTFTVPVRKPKKHGACGCKD